jgi:phytoene dehydrogenase-like protein
MSAERRRYDAVIIGAGLNGLTCAAYLARAGMRALVLERRHRVGGTAVTEEFAPGFRADVCRHDIGHVPRRIARELELERHGLRLVSLNPSIFAPGLDAEALWLDRGGPRADAVARRPSSVELSRWSEFTRLVRALAGFLEVLYRAPVPSVDASSLGHLATLATLALHLRLGLGKKDMVELLRVMPMSVAEWLDDWFENPLLKGVLATRGVMHCAQGPRAQGTAFNLLHHQVGRHAGAFRSHIRPFGGVGALADSIAASARAAGAEIRTGAHVARIPMKGNRAAGVALASGEEIEAARVISSVSPRVTFLELCDPTQLDPEFVRAVRNVRSRGVWAKVNLALDRLPAFRGGPRDDGKPPHSIVIAPDVDYVERAHDCAKYGGVSDRPWLDLFIPTVVDKALAPEGKHVMSVHLQYAPYHLREGAWDSAAREALGDLVVKVLAEYSPELPGLVLHRQVLTPKDLADGFSLPEGHAYHGEMALDQALFMRPVPAANRHATPAAGLFLCGSGSHPGGGIPGQAGANAAMAVAKGRK